MQSCVCSNGLRAGQPARLDARQQQQLLHAAPLAAPAARRQPASSSSQAAPLEQQRCSSTVRVQALQRQGSMEDMFSEPSSSSYPRSQHEQQFAPPEWHPRLFMSDSRRAALEHSARLYFEEVWNAGSIDLLDELAVSGVCFSDTLGMEADTFSRASLKALVQDFQASHPLLKYDLEDVLIDEQRSTAVVTYTVTAACLLPAASGVDATGHVSVVPGMDKIHFTKSGLISSIHSFRQRFMEEEAEPINWGDP